MILVARSVFFACVLTLFIISAGYGADRIDFCAVGDVLLDRGVKKTINKHGIDYIFENITNAISQNDLAYFNLETVLSNRGFPDQKQFIFRSEPEHAFGLKRAGFNIASVANNHAFDWGEEAFKDTLNSLNAADIYSVGFQTKNSENPLYIKKNGLSFAFFSFTDIYQPYKFDNNKNDISANVVSQETLKMIARTRNRIDFIIVSFHWGEEGSRQITERQKLLAYSAIDAGANIVLGHHPHVLQKIDSYKNGLIVYSLGNFIFDNHSIEQRQSMIFGCRFEKRRIASPYFVPVIIKGNRPYIAQGRESEEIVNLLQSLFTNNDLKLNDTGNRSLIKIGESALELTTPVYVHLESSYKIIIYPSVISLVDSAEKEIARLEINDRKQNIREAVMVKEGLMARFYVIFGDLKQRTGGKLGVINIDLKTKTIHKPLIDTHWDLNPWKIALCDVDGDRDKDICVGVWKQAKYDKNFQNRLFVYNREGNSLYPKWMGSKLALPFEDFSLKDLDNNGSDELIVLENRPDGKRRVASYKWNGFGFNGYKVLEHDSSRLHLLDYH